MDFPEKSQSTTDRLYTWDEVRAMLDKESMRRAEYIARILLELQRHVGEKVMKIAAKEIYQIGYEKGRMRAGLMAEEGKKNDLDNLANLISHPSAQLYLGNRVEVSRDELVVKEDYCPLPRRWKDLGYKDEQIIAFCLLFDQVDKGMVEGYNPQFEAQLSGCRGLAEYGFCQMRVRRKEDSPRRHGERGGKRR